MYEQSGKVQWLQTKSQKGSTLYGMQVTFNNQIKKEIYNPYKWYTSLQAYLQNKTFDVDVENKINKHSPKANNEQQTKTILINFMKEISIRKDITNDKQFRQRMGLPQLQCQLIEQSNRLMLGDGNSELIDVCWQPKHMILLTLQKCKVNKVTNLFNTFFNSKNITNTNGHIKIYCLQQYEYESADDSKIKSKEIISLSGQPISMKFNRKSMLLHVCTNIGIFIYSLTINNHNYKHELIQFIKQHSLMDYSYYAITGATYFITQSEFKVHSITKEFTMAIGGIKEMHCLAVQQEQQRLFIGTSNQIMIYDIHQLKETKYITKIVLDSVFSRLIVSEKYMFGLCSAGYISVFDLKPKSKENLISTLTNIDCPQNSKCISFSLKNKVLFLNKGKEIVIISTVNQPLYVGGNHNHHITSLHYDETNNILLSSSINGTVIVYNLSVKLSQPQLS